MKTGSGTLALQSELFGALSYATSKGFQIHPDAFAMLKGLDSDILKMVQEIIRQKMPLKNSVILVDDIKCLLNPKKASEQEGPGEQSCNILMDPTLKITSAEGVQGYAALFRSRFEKSMKIISQRPDSKRISKIASVKQGVRSASNKSVEGVKNARRGSTALVAGLLMSKRTKKNGLELAVDDYTGTLNVMAVTEEARKQCSLLALDQMVMLELENGGRAAPGMLTVLNVVTPDIPDHLANKSKSEAYAVLISDLHVGSMHFMEAEFLKFLEWLTTTDDEIVRKIKFLCFAGDVVDGIGIYPNQDKELIETDAAKQLAHATQMLARVPKHIKMIVMPGNHDPGRRALPQPSFPKEELAEELYSLENCTMVGNPAFVELNGVKILMYHGQSLDDVIATIPGLSYSKPAEAMKVFLKARHLAPTYGERTPIAPELEDLMVISEVPDILHSGHVHVVDIQHYRGTLVVNSGAWQRQTGFQKTMGIAPTPGIAVLVNLATLQPFTRDFNRPQ
jgi:DNA polymerase II small subunit